MISKTLEEWSETESSEEENELVQPNRDFPISSEEENNSEEEYEDEEFNIFELAQKTLKNNSDDFFNKETKDTNESKHKEIKDKQAKPSKMIIIEEKKIIKRKFNPRLPPPNKYNKNIINKFNNKINLKDFPTL
jgi:hypothetical protein